MSSRVNRAATSPFAASLSGHAVAHDRRGFPFLTSRNDSIRHEASCLPVGDRTGFRALAERIPTTVSSGTSATS